jgi:hypothetical protein
MTTQVFSEVLIRVMTPNRCYRVYELPPKCSSALVASTCVEVGRTIELIISRRKKNSKCVPAFDRKALPFLLHHYL